MQKEIPLEELNISVKHKKIISRYDDNTLSYIISKVKLWEVD